MVARPLTRLSGRPVLAGSKSRYGVDFWSRADVTAHRAARGDASAWPWETTVTAVRWVGADGGVAALDIREKMPLRLHARIKAIPLAIQLYPSGIASRHNGKLAIDIVHRVQLAVKEILATEVLTIPDMHPVVDDSTTAIVADEGNCALLQGSLNGPVTT